MSINYIPESVSSSIELLVKDPEIAVRVLEFTMVVESIKYLDFMNVDENTNLFDIIYKLKFMGLPDYIITELNDYRIKRNSICHNNSTFRVNLRRKDYYLEYALLATNLIGLIVRYVDNNYINFEHVERKYFRYLESKGRPIPENEKKYYMKKASKLSRSHIFTE